MHTGFVGMSRSGKTTLAAMSCRGLVQRGRRVAVLDRLKDQRWGAVEFITGDPIEFLKFALLNHGCHLFVDEWGSTIKKTAAVFDWLGTTSRHYGHSLWAIAHQYQQFAVALRDQFDRVYAFHQGKRSAELVAEDFCRPELPGLVTAATCGRGIFYEVSKFADLRSGRIDFTRGRLAA